MPKYTPAQLEQLAFDVLHAAGATHREAQLVGHHLVEANLAGHFVGRGTSRREPLDGTTGVACSPFGQL